MDKRHVKLSITTCPAPLLSTPGEIFAQQSRDPPRPFPNDMLCQNCLIRVERDSAEAAKATDAGVPGAEEKDGAPESVGAYIDGGDDRLQFLQSEFMSEKVTESLRRQSGIRMFSTGRRCQQISRHARYRGRVVEEATHDGKKHKRLLAGPS